MCIFLVECCESVIGRARKEIYIYIYIYFLSCGDRTNVGDQASRAVFLKLIACGPLLPFWLPKMTTDSYTLAQVNIVCPVDSYPKL